MVLDDPKKLLVPLEEDPNIPPEVPNVAEDGAAQGEVACVCPNAPPPDAPGAGAAKNPPPPAGAGEEVPKKFVPPPAVGAGAGEPKGAEGAGALEDGAGCAAAGAKPIPELGAELNVCVVFVPQVTILGILSKQCNAM